MNGDTIHRRNFLLHLQERAGYDHPVLLKEPAHEQPARSHLDQLHNEYAITQQLTEVPACARLRQNVMAKRRRMAALIT